MSLLNSKKKDEEASHQNSAAAMLGQAPTAQGGDSGGALGSAMGSMLQKKAPAPQQSTNSMLDEGLGKMNDRDEDDKDLLSM